MKNHINKKTMQTGKSVSSSSHPESSNRIILNSVIEGMNPGFTKSIKTEFSMLTSDEVAICSLMKAGFSDDKICEYLELTQKKLNESYKSIISKTSSKPKKVLKNLIKAF